MDFSTLYDSLAADLLVYYIGRAYVGANLTRRNPHWILTIFTCKVGMVLLSNADFS